MNQMAVPDNTLPENYSAAFAEFLLGTWNFPTTCNTSGLILLSAVENQVYISKQTYLKKVFPDGRNPEVISAMQQGS